MILQVAGLTPNTRVNGPGRRNMVHLQGCTLACPGCFNPDTHGAGGTAWSVDDLATTLLEGAPDGVTVSGGEPFQQAEGLGALFEALRQRGVDSILVFTGYDYAELLEQPEAEKALANCDVLVAGRYRAAERVAGEGLLSSANQRLELLTARHRAEDLLGLGGRVEIVITPEGEVRVTGFPPPALRKALHSLE